MPRALLVFGSSPLQVGLASAGTVKIARAMMDAGWEVDVLGFRADRRAPNDPFFADLLAGARVHEPRSLVAKPAAWVPGAVVKGRALLRERRHDLMVSFAGIPWAHVAALGIAGRQRLPWVAFFTDPWSNHTMARPAAARRALDRALEGRALARADAIVFTNPQLQEWVIGGRAGHERLRRKCVSIPYFFEPALYPPAPLRGAGERVLIRHMGNTPPGAFTPALLEALRLVKLEAPALWRRLDIEFYGSHRPAHGEEIRRLGLEERIRFLGPVPYKESLGLMREADVLLLLTVTPREYGGLGNATLYLKMVDYLGAERSIFALAGEGSPASRTLASSGGVCTAEEPAAIRDAFVRFLASPSPPAAEVRMSFAKEGVYPEWARVFERVQAGEGRRP